MEKREERAFKLDIECNPSAFKHGVTEADKSMARMTDEEADALDELWTRTTPEIDTGKPGFLTRKGFAMVSLDPVAATWLQAKASATHHSPTEIIGEMIRKEINASAEPA
jgi:hypothetical protein